MQKKVFLIVLDSFGIGNAPDAKEFGDEGSNTLAAIAKSQLFNVPNLKKLGLYNIDGVNLVPKQPMPAGAFGRLVEVSKGKDTTIGHWEIAGIESEQPLPVFPLGFPQKLIEEFQRKTGRKTLCNRPYSGTDVLLDYGEEHLKTGALIVYTSADSVFQLAANEAVVPVQQLYNYCEIARQLLTGPHAVGRVIARPFVGDKKENFKRTKNRHDYSVKPPAPTVLDALSESGHSVIGVGKIGDIFAGQGIGQVLRTSGNAQGMQFAMQLAEKDFEGLAFINLVDFDMLYGHRNNPQGYAAAMAEFDRDLGAFLPLLKKGDLLMITADHGCDPSTASTDHSRESVPLLVYGAEVKAGLNFGVKISFTTIASTIAEYFGLPQRYPGASLWQMLKK